MAPSTDHHPDTLPRWLRSDVLAWSAGLVGLLVVAALLAFLGFEQRSVQRDVATHAELYARLLEDHTARLLSSSELALQTLAQAISEDGSAAQVAELAAATVRGQPFVRSISWLDPQGRVQASSRPENVGVLVPEAVWRAGPGGVGRLQRARDEVRAAGHRQLVSGRRVHARTPAQMSCNLLTSSGLKRRCASPAIPAPANAPATAALRRWQAAAAASR